MNGEREAETSILHRSQRGYENRQLNEHSPACSVSPMHSVYFSLLDAAVCSPLVNVHVARCGFTHRQFYSRDASLFNECFYIHLCGETRRTNFLCGRRLCSTCPLPPAQSTKQLLTSLLQPIFTLRLLDQFILSLQTNKYKI